MAFSLQNTLAKALYDNKAECSDELAFRKGDILTVLDQNVIGSEGWWKCSLHGRQGLAPANRLQLLPGAQALPLPPSTHGDVPEPPAGQQNIYQVPSVPKPPVVSSTYEKMEGWVKPPARACTLPAQGTYQVPALAAQLLNERTQSSTRQHLFTLPRASRASVPNIRSEVYDVPSMQRRESLFTRSAATPPTARKGSLLLRSAECFQEEQQLYNIPSGPEKTGAVSHKDSPVGNLYDVPPKRETSASGKGFQKKCWGHYNTLPNPRKSEWIYDIPVSPEQMGLEQSPSGPSLENQVLYDIPPARYKALTTSTEAKVVNPQLYDIPPTQRKLVFPDVPLYDIPPPRDMLLLPQNGSCEAPPRHLDPKAENQISGENVYDIPKGLPNTSQSKKEREKPNSSSGTQAYCVPVQISRDTKLEHDRSSVSSADSRSNTVSTFSNPPAELMSSSEEPVKEIKLDLDVAIETLTRLQHGVSSSVASLMIFVSSKWRLEEHLEKNIEEIHRAVDHIKVSLGEFLAFAQAIKVNASYITDNNLQTRIKKQLEILINSFKILTETREALNNCNWSLEALVLRKPQNNPDDLDRFVMVARTIPDDIKRFVSIIIANGKLLFRKSEKEQETKQSNVSPEYKMAKQIPVPRRIEIESLQRNAQDKPNQSQVSQEKTKENAIEDCEYVQLQAQKIISGKEVSKKSTDSKPKVLPSSKKNVIQSKQDPAKKIALPEHCRLCFGALHKAIAVFNNSLSNNQPPEVFISHSKLIIMVGQKIVDSLCQETQERDARNDILHSSSRFCSLLKNLALATKNAAIQYPNADAMRELQNQNDELYKYTQQFRAMME
ncbi:cas scaffolding protein family member 4 isoform X2 [Oxyura jamaicensis]|uniref:cas scaffolding protein family member 4 isoform X2 n=1 Tax=Oxyura jamaicensis TaxID=8884 RepID=UPI0015A56EEA|nr:cas scaffolding protein family member 4 isoform X2 [Oxyura jamaicensis]XP_035199607.1 cas scaffolding protein family member 4 isoform X2 [Oxyura jamaicensis]